jgi:hypothetical protein
MASSMLAPLGFYAVDDYICNACHLDTTNRLIETIRGIMRKNCLQTYCLLSKYL